MKGWFEFSHVLSTFYMKSMFNLINTLKFYALIMLWSILNHLWLFCTDHDIIHQTSCITLLSKMVSLKHKYCHLLDVARTLMFNMHVPKEYWKDVILTVITCHHLCWIAKSLFSILHPCVSLFLYLLVCLGVLSLFTTWSLIETSWLLDLLSVYFLVILELKKAIVVTVLSNESIMSVQMLPSLSLLHSFLQEITIIR